MQLCADSGSAGLLIETLPPILHVRIEPVFMVTHERMRGDVSALSSKMGAVVRALRADHAPDVHDVRLGASAAAGSMEAGIAALLLSVDPSLTPREVKRILRETADDIGTPGIDDRTGAGRVNAAAAVRAVRDKQQESPS